MVDGNQGDITGIYRKKGFIKGKALRFLRTNSVRDNFEQSKRDLERGYANANARSRKLRTEVKFTDRNEALRNKTKQTKEILPFVTTYNPASPNLKKILMKHWDIIQQQPKLKHIFNQPPIVSYKENSLVDILVRENFFNLATITKSMKRLKENETWQFAYDHLTDS